PTVARPARLPVVERSRGEAPRRLPVQARPDDVNGFASRGAGLDGEVLAVGRPARGVAARAAERSQLDRISPLAVADIEFPAPGAIRNEGDSFAVRRILRRTGIGSGGQEQPGGSGALLRQAGPLKTPDLIIGSPLRVRQPMLTGGRDGHID